jgi:HPt (histidine-containing phosphotransfer) domain-containing protein
MDGLQATAAIRRREQPAGGHVPIVAMTAYAMKGDRERCLAAGMDGYVAKPVRQADLLAAIAAVLPGPAVPTVEAEGPTTGGAFDRAAALAELDGDEQLLRELAGIFLVEWPKWAAELHAALAGGEAERLGIVVHAVKGAVGVLGAAGAFAAAGALETMAREGDLSRTGEGLAALEGEVEALRPALAAIACPIEGH